MLWECGVEQDVLEHLPQVFENATEGKPLTAANLIDRKTTEPLFVAIPQEV